MSEYDPDELSLRWKALRDENPRLRIRDAADQLNVSEAQLVALGIGESATRLCADWADLLLELHHLGPLMGLTRNDHAVHERHGGYSNIRILGEVHLVREGGFEVALFLSEWCSGFAVSEVGHEQVRHSLQFFSQDGCAVHKIYLTNESHLTAFKELVDQFRSSDQSRVLAIETRATSHVYPDADALWSSRLLLDWPLAADGQPLTVPDLSLSSEAIAHDPLPAGAAEAVLTRAAALNTPLVIAVGNPGALQLHRGPIHKILRTGPWINVLDDPFNLHLRDAQLSSGWHIRELTEEKKPSLCWCDEQGRPALQIFSEDCSGSWDECLSTALIGDGEVAA